MIKYIYVRVYVCIMSYERRDPTIWEHVKH